MIVELLGYAPDADPTIVGVLTNCSGVVPSLKGMKGAPSPATTPLASLGATCQGAAVCVKLDGTTRLFAGTPTTLKEAGVSTWSDVSGTVYSTVNTGRWRFAQQGNVSFAANGAETLQASVSSGAFTGVNTAPIAALVETVNAFVLVANTSSASNGWQCSAINNYLSWTVSVSTQAASGTLTETPGAITALRRFGNAVVAYKKTAMYLGIYTGRPNIWEFNLLPGTAGAMSQEAVVNVGTPDNPIHLFMGEDDFYRFDGSRALPIGTNRVKEAVFSAILQSRYYACAALHDRKNTRVYFYYPVADSVFPDHCVVYNYRTNKWGVDDRQIEFPVEYVTPGMTYTALGGSYATYDSLPMLPYDLAFLSQTDPTPAFFDLDNKLKSLTGPATSTSFTTGDFGDDQRFSTVTRIRPRFLTAPTSAMWTHYSRKDEGATLSADTAVSLMNGSFDLLRSARWHRGTMSFVGDWEMAGFSPEWAVDGLE